MLLYAMLDAMTVVLAEFKRDWDDVVEAVFAFRYHARCLRWCRTRSLLPACELAPKAT